MHSPSPHNDALAPTAAATSLEIDWGVVVFEGGVGGEDTDEGRKGVHLGVLRGLSCRRGGCDGCEAAGKSNCLHRQLIYQGMVHPCAYRDPANDPGKASTRAWVAMTKAIGGAVADSLLLAPRTRSGGVLNTACCTSTLTHRTTGDRTASGSKITT